MKKRKKVILDSIRLDSFIKKEFNLSSSQIERIFKDKLIKLNNKIPKKRGIKLKKGDIVEFELIENNDKVIQIPENLRLKKLFEDEYILVIDKPEGISVHQGAGKTSITIQDLFLNEYPEVKNNMISDRMGIVHRLDKETSGVLILAKDERSLKRLQKSFKRREVQKTYYAIVKGIPRFNYNEINLPIRRSLKNRTRFEITEIEDENSKQALTYYTVLLKRDNFSLLKVNPKTGRTHQIRVHLSYIGNPIIGDKLYSKEKKINYKRMYLHAYSIKFPHPITGNQICVYSFLPKSFLSFINQAKS